MDKLTSHKHGENMLVLQEANMQESQNVDSQ
jgi:hypothetical protein